MRKLLGSGVAAVLLATGGIMGAGTAVAAGDPTFSFDGVDDIVLMPGEGWGELSPSSTGGQVDGRPDGTYVYALSKKPLTDATWSGGGLPAGLRVDRADGCKAKAGTAGVYLCDVKDWNNPGPVVSATSTAVNGTKAYYGLVYVPRGSSLDAGVKEAQTAGSKAIGTRRAHAVIVAKTKAQVAKNTMTPSTPALPAGGTVKHTVKLHAADKGRIVISLGAAPGFRHWDGGELKVSVDGVTAGGAAGAECDHSLGELGHGGDVRCDIKAPGDYTVTYGLKAGATAPAWRLRNTMTYEVYSFGTGNPEKVSDFAVSSPIPVTERYRLVGRSASGDLYDYRGTGKASRPFGSPELVGGTPTWNQYSALTRLGPVTVQSTGPGAVARDRNGVLWFYRMSGDGGIYKDRLRVGAGWNSFNILAGASDLTGDKKADLLARDTAGVLWLYPGAGSTAAPFGARVRIGGGWGGYNSLVGGTDVTGDGKADLVARDTAGRQWLYQGTGVSARPFGGRTQIGTGWHVYNSMVAPGDLNADGKADLVARDGSGVLWYYQGTGRAAQPYATRARIGAGWQTYNTLF
ncbi:VCBS repeat-containing protein [Streptomyces sp. MBT42]|uniref:FG-GAP repeat domain-containing protein n=1 Tax=Streptomyces sp. MBT42 TaxID=1488373 RepID=UPI001E577C4A|nr:VCBS repeat-containing protein [Streptomyces sp. MBT42]MCD2465131.1 VCBS repeat-containing protein [Streptomyces sp. MBT42]